MALFLMQYEIPKTFLKSQKCLFVIDVEKFVYFAWSHSVKCLHLSVSNLACVHLWNGAGQNAPQGVEKAQVWYLIQWLG